MARQPIRFPDTFLWGASISAHQVEGGNHNQWSVWELEHAKSLAAQAPYHFGELESWEHIAKQAKDPNNYVSGKACDHRNRYEQDFELLKKLNMNTLRFSVEWSRIQPTEDSWDVEAIAYYREYVRSLRAKGITPVVTLFHFTLPVWFSDRGGFARRVNLKYYERFVTKVMDELGPHIEWIITINEPEVYANQSYLYGMWPPAVTNRRSMMAVLENLIRAHKRATKIIRSYGSRYKVSMAYNIANTYPGDDARLSMWSATVGQRTGNYALWRTRKSIDFIGLNYYFSNRVYGYRTHNPNSAVNDLGWDMQPADIRYVLESLADRYNLPILITENGLADAKDEYRQWWLMETLRAVHQSVKSGVNVLGYLHWSLLDNFEWDKGFWPRFGLYEVDYVTMKRKPRRSAQLLARAIKSFQGKS